MLHINKTRRQIIRDLDYGAHVIGTIVVGFMTLVAFFFYEAFVPTGSLVPSYLMKNRECMMFVVFAGIGGMLFHSLTILWPSIIAKLYTAELIYNGWLSMSVGAANALGTIVGGITFALIGHVRYQLFTAVTMMTLFIGAMASTTQYTKSRSVAFTVTGMFFSGFSEGLCNASVSFTVNPEEIGLAFGVLCGLRVCLGGIATAIYDVILTNRNAAIVNSLIPQAALKAGVPSSSVPEVVSAVMAGAANDVLATIPGMNDTLGAAVHVASQDAFSGVVKVFSWY
ncbi:hypothetical protein LTR13_011437 [Exophiala sideris]|nr:hypothetical protein LTR13_011437 [Exophiala sideris]KAK5175958.1 hypothetical protein LTR44_011476 [Eurotiomycetes sp. CCFEE 6388]